MVTLQSFKSRIVYSLKLDNLTVSTNELVEKVVT